MLTAICLSALYFLLLNGFPSLVVAQTVQAELWNTPDGRQPDLTQTFTNGQTIPLSWNSWDSTAYLDTTTNLVDLWGCSSDYPFNQYNILLKSNLNLTFPGSYAWTLSIPDKYLVVSAKYMLQFKYLAPTFDPTGLQLASPGFLVLQSSASSSTSAGSSSSTTPNTPSISVLSTSSIASTGTPSASSIPHKAGLTSGAKAGIGVGVTLGALGVLGVFILFLRRKTGHTARSTPFTSHDEKQEPYNQYPPVELYERAVPVELYTRDRTALSPLELDASNAAR